jgi:two-component system OmpR family response regulator
MPETPVRGHVLLVEDSTLLSDAFRIMLERAGFRVSVADTLARALEVPDTADVILLDVTLPDGDGMSLLPALAERGRSPRHSIALTGRDDDATRTRCLQAGCSDVIVKPVKPSELVRALRKLLD